MVTASPRVGLTVLEILKVVLEILKLTPLNFMGELEPIRIKMFFNKFIFGISFSKFGIWGLTIGLGFISLEIDFEMPKDVGFFKFVLER